mmetsp:Transcript_5748/g.20810  ORF Transcript_5748/g.20810 Transcript_5748/m.20810 type:complete len:229 (-) Transcript_5748:60-746(-)
MATRTSTPRASIAASETNSSSRANNSPHYNYIYPDTPDTATPHPPTLHPRSHRCAFLSTNRTKSRVLVRLRAPASTNRTRTSSSRRLSFVDKNDTTCTPCIQVRAHLYTTSSPLANRDSTACRSRRVDHSASRCSVRRRRPARRGAREAQARCVPRTPTHRPRRPRARVPMPTHASPHPSSSSSSSSRPIPRARAPPRPRDAVAHRPRDRPRPRPRPRRRWWCRHRCR